MQGINGRPVGIVLQEDVVKTTTESSHDVVIREVVDGSPGLAANREAPVDGLHPREATVACEVTIITCGRSWWTHGSIRRQGVVGGCHATGGIQRPATFPRALGRLRIFIT